MKRNALKRPEELLTEAAARLKSQSPGMSLRGVAGRLQISPSYWSKILHGQKPLPAKLLPKVAKILALDTQQVAQLQRSILSAIESEELQPETGLTTNNLGSESPIENYENLGRGDFWLLEEWYYLAILNLFTLNDFIPTPEAIGFRLGLKTAAVTEAVARLRGAGYLSENAGGVITRTQTKVRFPTDRSFAPVRKYHALMLQKAREELLSAGEGRFDERQISAVCFAGSSKKLKEARLILEEAMYRAANLLADEPSSDEVYQLNLQLFPLSKRPVPR